jgi:hypothetical protein
VRARRGPDVTLRALPLPDLPVWRSEPAVEPTALAVVLFTVARWSAWSRSRWLLRSPRRPAYVWCVKGVDADEPTRPEVSAITNGSQSRENEMDVIETGPRRPPLPWSQGRGIAGLLVAALVVGALAGYLAGIRHAEARTAGPGPHASTTDSVAPLAAQSVPRTGNQCSAQLGDRLQLGVEIVNQSATTVTLHRVETVLPLDGLRATASAWGSCGQLSSVDAATPHSLPPGATTWLTITFDVLIPCPAAIPVLFTLTYTQAGHTTISDLSGFPDLGDVPYTRCPAGS